MVLEKEREVAPAYQTGHNCGAGRDAFGNLLQAGFVAGDELPRRQTGARAVLPEGKHIPFDLCGKVIVCGLERRDSTQLERNFTNEVSPMTFAANALVPERLKELEPHVVGRSKPFQLRIPEAGIVDYRQVAAEKMAERIKAADGELKIEPPKVDGNVSS